jgi:hypothetical protein
LQIRIIGDTRVENSIVVEMKCRRRIWRFLVWPVIGNVGSKEMEHLRNRILWSSVSDDAYRLIGKKNFNVFPMILAIGKVTQAASDLAWGHMLIPTNFGGYIGAGCRRDYYEKTIEYPKHKFILSGITHKKIMEERIEAFQDWLKEKGKELESQTSGDSRRTR